MPLDLKAYRETTRPVTVTVPAGEFGVSYRPAEYTPAWQKRITTVGEDPDAFARHLAPVLASWELTDGGKPYPLTPDTLCALGMDIINAIVTAIAADASLAVDPNARKT